MQITRWWEVSSCSAVKFNFNFHSSWIWVKKQLLATVPHSIHGSFIASNLIIAYLLAICIGISLPTNQLECLSLSLSFTIIISFYCIEHYYTNNIVSQSCVAIIHLMNKYLAISTQRSVSRFVLDTLLGWQSSLCTRWQCNRSWLVIYCNWRSV